MNMMFYTYLVRCSDNSLYCGQTSDLEKRIREHNTSQTKGSKYVRSRKPVKLAYYEEYQTRKEAMKREVDIKKLPKCKKEELVLNKA
jgi:putative endonuclease